MTCNAVMALGSYMMAAAFVLQGKYASPILSLGWVVLGSIMAFSLPK